MAALFDIPDEFIQPIIPCLKLLEKGNVFIFAKADTFWKKFCYPVLFVVSLGTFLVSLTVYMCKAFRGEIRLDELAYIVSVQTVCTQTILKTIIVAFKQKEIRAIIVQLGRMWRTEDLTEIQIIKKNALLKRLKFCYSVFFWMNIVGSWQYIIAPLLETVCRKYILQQEGRLLLPFSCWFPFDPTGTWGRYIGVYIFETYSMFRIVYFYIGSELLMITLCSHLATEFTLLQEDLLNFKPWDDIAGLKIIVTNHQKLITLAHQLDDIFNKIIFVNLTSATISICFFGFGAKVARGALDMAINFVAVVTLIFPVLNLCYYGEFLREASAGMADSVYHNLWYKGDIRYQKLLCFLMTRAQKPCCLTSMKYNPIVLTTFTTVLSTTWSYFSLASSLYEGES